MVAATSEGQKVGGIVAGPGREESLVTHVADLVAAGWERADRDDLSATVAYFGRLPDTRRRSTRDVAYACAPDFAGDEQRAADAYEQCRSWTR